MGSSSAAACPLSMKFAWHMAKLTHLPTVHGCLHNAASELREVRQALQGSTAWDSSLSGPLQKKCASPALGVQFGNVTPSLVLIFLIEGVAQWQDMCLACTSSQV